MSNDKRKRTPWFPADVLPVRDGVYQVHWLNGWGQHDPTVKYRKFKGGFWYCGAETVHGAAKQDMVLGPHSYRRWRGLTQDYSAEGGSNG